MSRNRLQQIHAQLAIHRGMEVDRETYLDHMTFRRHGGPMFTEIFGPLLGLKEEWAAQGATPQELDFSAFRYRRPMFGSVPVSTGWMGGESVVLEETGDYLLTRDARGRTMKLSKRAATIPLPQDYPVKTMDDWLRIKPHYQFSDDRLRADWRRVANEHRRAGRVVTVHIPGGYDEPRQLMGEEHLALACYDQPELIHDILQTIGDTAERVIDLVSAAVPVDQLMVHEDMAGNAGPLMGPHQVREFIAPYYRRVWNLLSSRGARVFGQDSDGDISPLLDVFVEAGLNFSYPVEPVGGMDILALRERYGTRLAFMGGIDKHVLRRTPEEIEAELECKLPLLLRTGGCIFGLDHRIPNGTPLANYRFYVAKAWEILEREWSDFHDA